MKFLCDGRLLFGDKSITSLALEDNDIIETYISQTDVSVITYYSKIILKTSYIYHHSIISVLINSYVFVYFCLSFHQNTADMILVKLMGIEDQMVEIVVEKQVPLANLMFAYCKCLVSIKYKHNFTIDN